MSGCSAVIAVHSRAVTSLALCQQTKVVLFMFLLSVSVFFGGPSVICSSVPSFQSSRSQGVTWKSSGLLFRYRCEAGSHRLYLLCDVYGILLNTGAADCNICWWSLMELIDTWCWFRRKTTQVLSERFYEGLKGKPGIFQPKLCFISLQTFTKYIFCWPRRQAEVQILHFAAQQGQNRSSKSLFATNFSQNIITSVIGNIE